MHKTLAIIFAVSIPLLVWFLYVRGANEFLIDALPFMYPEEPVITFNEKTPLKVIVVADDASRIQGLSYRESLPSTQGMLFVFDKADYYGIWMKEMRFSIDIMWLNEEGRIIHLEEGVHPDTYPQAFKPPVPARFVIETNAHFVSTFDIQLGDYVQIPAYVLPEDLRK